MPALNKEKIIRMISIIFFLIVIVAILSTIHRHNSLTLADYERQQLSTESSPAP